MSGVFLLWGWPGHGNPDRLLYQDVPRSAHDGGGLCAWLSLVRGCDAVLGSEGPGRGRLWTCVRGVRGIFVSLGICCDGKGRGNANWPGDRAADLGWPSGVAVSVVRRSSLGMETSLGWSVDVDHGGVFCAVSRARAQQSEDAWC